MSTEQESTFSSSSQSISSGSFSYSDGEPICRGDMVQIDGEELFVVKGIFSNALPEVYTSLSQHAGGIPRSFVPASKLTLLRSSSDLTLNELSSSFELSSVTEEFLHNVEHKLEGSTYIPKEERLFLIALIRTSGEIIPLDDPAVCELMNRLSLPISNKSAHIRKSHRKFLLQLFNERKFELIVFVKENQSPFIRNGEPVADRAIFDELFLSEKFSITRCGFVLSVRGKLDSESFKRKLLEKFSQKICSKFIEYTQVLQPIPDSPEVLRLGETFQQYWASA